MKSWGLVLLHIVTMENIFPGFVCPRFGCQLVQRYMIGMFPKGKMREHNKMNAKIKNKSKLLFIYFWRNATQNCWVPIHIKSISCLILQFLLAYLDHKQTKFKLSWCPSTVGVICINSLVYIIINYDFLRQQGSNIISRNCTRFTFKIPTNI